MTLPFDRVVVTIDSSATQLSIAQFLALPLDRRIGYVLARQVQFFLGQTPVDRRAALASLHQQATARSA
jgi:hypothetical protein